MLGHIVALQVYSWFMELNMSVCVSNIITKPDSTLYRLMICVAQKGAPGLITRWARTENLLGLKKNKK